MRHPRALAPALLVAAIACGSKEATGSGNGGVNITVGLPHPVVEFSLPSPDSQPGGIVAGPDGNLWFTESAGNRIGHITLAGQVTEYPIPTAGSAPLGIVAGPDGNLWFTEGGVSKIGRITPAGTISEYPIPTGSDPTGIASDKVNLYVAERGASKIGLLTPGGSYSELQYSAGPTSPENITVNSDGSVWFTEGIGSLGRIYSSLISQFPILSPVSGDDYFIASGPDGNLWFTARLGNFVATISASTASGTAPGVITEFKLPSDNSGPSGIALGPDGNLWFAEAAGRIGTVTPKGAIVEYSVPTSSGEPYGIAAGPDGNLWFTERSSGKIGVVVP